MADKSELYLYNTLGRTKEPFVPVSPGEARLYSCGPTVYDTAHIGNMRSYIFMDILRRVLKRNGYRLLHVMNITDVGHLVSDEDTGEDKMIKGARERQKSPWEIAAEYTDLFMNDAASLNIGIPEIVPKATDHIPQMLEMIVDLQNKGYAYELSDGVYFDIGKFDGYGMLSRMDPDERLAGARIEVNPEKRHWADFALWIKAPKEHIMQWDSPWGVGYPGWHIECSAMSIHYLGDRIDIHTGGADHIPVHHENEIAQSDAYAGHRVVNAWMHGEFLLIDGGRMGKSLKNMYSIADIRDAGYNPLAYRYFCLNGHYRSKLNFTWDGMRSASVSFKRFVEEALAHRDGADGTQSLDEYLRSTASAFYEAVNDDLNIPKALGIAWQLIRYPEKSARIFDLLLDMDEIFGFGLKEAGADSSCDTSTDKMAGATDEDAIPQEILDMIGERNAARDAKDWKRSDELREQIKTKGYAVQDSKQGVKIEKI